MKVDDIGFQNFFDLLKSKLRLHIRVELKALGAIWIKLLNKTKEIRYFLWIKVEEDLPVFRLLA